MSHLKRRNVPRKWPIPKKEGATFVVKPRFNLEESVPILIALRDMLKIAQNRKEVKKAIQSGNILVNNKITRDERNSILLFDTLTIIPLKKYYQLGLSEYGKFKLEEIKESEINKKISKIIDKKMQKGKKIQLNLSDGRNLLYDGKCNINDSVIINFKDKKITGCLPLKEKANSIIYGGKHAGKKGIITKLELKRKIAKLNTGDKEINVLIKHLMVIE